MIEVLKEALEALKDVGVLTDREWQAVHKNKANELRQAIAELESQEPDAWRIKVETKLRDGSVDVGYQLRNEKFSVYDEPLYTHPPQRTEQEPVAWLGFNPRSGAPEFACDKPAPSVMRDYNMKPLVYTNSTPPAAQPAQEPVAWMYQEYRDDDQFGWRDEIYFIQPPNDPIYFRNIVPVYAHPPQRSESSGKPSAWVGLTEQERNDIEDYCEMMIGKPAFDAIEAKLKELNT
jgi:hypothetical protein